MEQRSDASPRLPAEPSPRTTRTEVRVFLPDEAPELTAALARVLLRLLRSGDRLDRPIEAEHPGECRSEGLAS